MILKNNLQLKMKILLLMVVNIFKGKFNEFNKNCSQFIISTENVFKCLKLNRSIYSLLQKELIF